MNKINYSGNKSQVKNCLNFFGLESADSYIFSAAALKLFIFAYRSIYSTVYFVGRCTLVTTMITLCHNQHHYYMHLEQ